MTRETTALIIVDMQNYYLSPSSDYHRYFDQRYPGCLNYISERCGATVIPRIRLLLDSFRENGLDVFYLRLCGRNPDRSDLHRIFQDTHYAGMAAGFHNIYPLRDDPMASVIEEIAPLAGETVVDKTTFSPFTGTVFESTLRKNHVSTCVFTGLATSQCVETTARDASDRGFTVVHAEDAQADYDEMTHSASLFSSRGVCGGIIMDAEEILQTYL